MIGTGAFVQFNGDKKGIRKNSCNLNCHCKLQILYQLIINRGHIYYETRTVVHMSAHANKRIHLWQITSYGLLS